MIAKLPSRIPALLARIALAFQASMILCAWSAHADYRLRPGDVVEVSVAGLPELRQRVFVEPDGTITLPVLGRARVAGLTGEELHVHVATELAKRVIRHKLADGREQIMTIQYGDVAARIAEYRPIFISGDVANPGQHPFRPLMSVRQAVVLSGGFSLVRNPAQLARYDPVDLERDYRAISLELAKEHVHIWRLKAERDDRAELQRASLAEIDVDEPVIAEQVHLENELLATRSKAIQQERSFLSLALRQADEQIALLQKLEAEEARAVHAEAREKELVEQMILKGTVTRPKSAESRRTVQQSSTRHLQSSINLSQARIQRDELKLRLERLTSQRRIDALRQIGEANLRRQEIGLRLAAAAEKLRLVGRPGALTPQGATPEITIVRRDERGVHRIRSSEDAELQPGDVVEVVARLERRFHVGSR